MKILRRDGHIVIIIFEIKYMESSLHLYQIPETYYSSCTIAIEYKR